MTSMIASVVPLILLTLLIIVIAIVYRLIKNYDKQNHKI